MLKNQLDWIKIVDVIPFSSFESVSLFFDSDFISSYLSYFHLVIVSCGTTVRDNCSYLVQSALTTGLEIPCSYSVCRLGSNICRIRYDFTVSYSKLWSWLIKKIYFTLKFSDFCSDRSTSRNHSCYRHWRRCQCW